MPNIALVVCGAPLARRTSDLALALTGAGWDVTVVGTQAARSWLDADALTQVTGRPPRFELRAPDEAKRAPKARAILICPATFNTVNKIAAGITDNYALGLICEGIGAGIPVLAVPMINEKLWGHFRLASSLTDLTGAGVRFMDARTGEPACAPVPSGTGEAVSEVFQTSWIVDLLESAA